MPLDADTAVGPEVVRAIGIVLAAALAAAALLAPTSRGRAWAMLAALARALPGIRGGEEHDPPRANGAMEWLLAGAVLLYALQAAYSTSLDKALEQTVFFYVPFALLFAVVRDIDWSTRLLRAGFGVLIALALAFAA